MAQNDETALDAVVETASSPDATDGASSSDATDAEKSLVDILVESEAP
ncbi:hypothetical protein P7F88_25555 [Vibrio hannami]|nr:hypothetical protein [Vibrio hannami]MDG3089233.1 hypothetical protein [Vibrio hannami]